MLSCIILGLLACGDMTIGGAVAPTLSFADDVLEQTSEAGAFDLALGHTVDVTVTGDPGAAVLVFASATPPPVPPPLIGGVPLGVDPATLVILVNGAQIGPGGTFGFAAAVPASLPAGGEIYIQAATVATGAPGPKLAHGLVLTLVDARIFDFKTGTEGFTADISDYTLAVLPGIDPQAGLAFLPPPLDVTEPAFRTESTNTADDVFHYLKHRIDGLAPATPRAFRVEVRFASDKPIDSVGIGGSPGASVILKAGGNAVEPKTVPLPSDPDHFVLNLDKGDQSVGGSDIVVLGPIGTPSGSTGWFLLEQKMATPLVKSTDAAGSLWICVGTDSGFEGTTEVFYDRIVVKLLD